MSASVLLAVLVTTAAQAESPQVQAPADEAAPSILQNARRLTDELRFEEAVVEYQRYLSRGPRPTPERAKALLELGFLHLLLGDERSAQLRAVDALELDPTLRLPPDAPAKQVRFLEQMRQEVTARVRLELLPRQPDDAVDLVRVKMTDNKGQAKRVLVRHGLTANGPFYATAMRCDAGVCSARVPPVQGNDSYTLWYFIEAQGNDGTTLAQVRNAVDPIQVTVTRSRPWFKNPWVWGGTATVLLAAGAIVYFTSPQPAR